MLCFGCLYLLAYLKYTKKLFLNRSTFSTSVYKIIYEYKKTEIKIFKNINLCILMENNGPKLVCRKCKGPHLTIKCGKENKSVIENIIIKSENQTFNKHEEYQKPYEKINKDTNVSNPSVGYESGFKNKDFNNKDFKHKDFKNKDFKNENFNNKDFKHDRRPLHKVKMSNLPVDMSEEELYDLLYEWGHVVRMRLLNYESNSTAYIEFKDKEPADYIVEALDKTPFEHIMLDVERLYD